MCQVTPGMASPDLNYYFVPVFLLTLGELSSTDLR